MQRRAFYSLVALAIFVCAAAAQTLTFPALTGRVVDEAGLLDAAARASLTQTSADLEARSTDQLVVVTLKSLQGTSIEDYGYQLGRRWQIGQKDKNNGVLLIVAPNERKVRIEVGYGLEGTLTDAISKFIIENSILPRFKANDYPGGIQRGVEDIVQVLTGDAEEYKSRAAQGAPAQSPSAASPDSIWPGIFILGAIALVLIFCATLAGALCNFIFQLLYIIAASSGRGGSSGGSWSSGSSGGGFSGGGGSFGGGGSSGSW